MRTPATEHLTLVPEGETLSSQPGRRRPNLIVILADDHAPHAISAYGSRLNRTPSIDRIAHEGALLGATFCTNSICSPSRASILTGTYSHVNGVPAIFAEFDYRVPTFIDVLHENGYQTATLRQVAPR